MRVICKANTVDNLDKEIRELRGEAEPDIFSKEDQAFRYLKKQDSYGLEFRIILANYTGTCRISLGYRGLYFVFLT